MVPFSISFEDLRRHFGCREKTANTEYKFNATKIPSDVCRQFETVTYLTFYWFLHVFTIKVFNCDFGPPTTDTDSMQMIVFWKRFVKPLSINSEAEMVSSVILSMFYWRKITILCEVTSGEIIISFLITIFQSYNIERRTTADEILRSGSKWPLEFVRWKIWFKVSGFNIWSDYCYKMTAINFHAQCAQGKTINKTYHWSNMRLFCLLWRYSCIDEECSPQTHTKIVEMKWLNVTFGI